MKKLILITGLLMFSCTGMETTNKAVNQKEVSYTGSRLYHVEEIQSPKTCRDFVVHESGQLVPSCKKTVNLKGIKMPPICMNFVVDETLALSDNQFQSSEYKECRSILLRELVKEETTKDNQFQIVIKP